MTLILPVEEDRRAARMKPKSSSGNEKNSIDVSGRTATTIINRDETSSFLNFSRENLTISHSELEQGFKKQTKCFRVRRQTLLSLIAILVALICAGIEIWKLHRVINNTRDIEMMKSDIETLRHRLYGEDFTDELKAFEEQLYANDGEIGDQDSGEADIEGADYDNNYDEEDYSPNWNDYASDSSESTSETTTNDRQSSLLVQSSQNPPLSAPRNDQTSTNRQLVEMLAVLHKVEAAKRDSQELLDKNIAREHLLDDDRDSAGRETNKNENKRQVRDTAEKNYEKNMKKDHQEKGQRAFLNEETPVHSIFAAQNRTRHDHRILEATTEGTARDRHPPKKYFSITRSDNSQASSVRHDSVSFSNHSRQQRARLHHRQGSELMRRSLQGRGMTRRNLRAPKQVFAAHYGADSALFGMDDEHTGNGRAKHNEGIFKAWRPSNWVTDLGMSKHFTLSRDGRLTVHEAGLYIVYGQIHYLDEHDENGFHLLVNGQPILQCMVYSPGVGHKSRSCFSAQITLLEAGDALVLKDVGPARYTLFQHDKSFFGLAKLGDSREQQPKHTMTQPQETRR